MGALNELVAGLVEADVAVVADAQQLHIHATQRVDQIVIQLALALSVGIQAVGQVDILGSDIDVVEQVVVHEVSIALIMLGAQTHILVQIHGAHLGEVQIAIRTAADQFLVSAHGRAAGSQAQNTVRLQHHLSRQQVSHLAAGIIIVFRTDKSHDKISFSLF